VLQLIFIAFPLQQSSPPMAKQKLISSSTNHSYAFWDGSTATEGPGEKPISEAFWIKHSEKHKQKALRVLHIQRTHTFKTLKLIPPWK